MLVIVYYLNCILFYYIYTYNFKLKKGFIFLYILKFMLFKNNI